MSRYMFIAPFQTPNNYLTRAESINRDIPLGAVVEIERGTHSYAYRLVTEKITYDILSFEIAKYFKKLS